MVDLLAWGAKPDGTTLCTAALQRAIDETAAAGGGTVTVPAGRWLTGSLFLKSRIRLWLEPGAVLLGSPRQEDYPLIEARWEGQTRLSHAPLVGGTGLTDVGIEGRGTIDGQGEPWWKWFKEKSLAHPRPRLISFTDCENLVLEGFTATRSPSWTINPVRCLNVRIHGLTVRNPADSPNTDGINPDSCRAVRISDCFVSVGDDCITIKAGTEHEASGLRAPCEDVTVTNCVLESGHGGVVIGSEMSGGVRRIAISNCIFRGTDRGIRIKSRRGRGGAVEDVVVSNIVMTDVLCPLTVNLYYGCGAWGDSVVGDKGLRPVDSGTPAVRNLSLSNIVARRVKLAAAFVYGLPESPVTGVTLRDVSIELDPDHAEAGQAEMADGLPDLCRHGLWARNVENLSLSGVRVTGAGTGDRDFDASVILSRD